MQRVTPGVGDTFGPLEVALKEIFVTMLYHCLREGVLWEGRTAVRRRGQIQAEEDLTAALEGAPVFHARRLQQAAKTRAWITVLPSTVNRTELGSQEWRDALFLLYGLDPPDLPKYCDRC